MSKADSSSARGRARELLVQALYQQQIAGHGDDELVEQFRERPDYRRVDREYFDQALKGILEKREVIEGEAAKFLDRPFVQLDPVERGILLLGFYELRAQPDVPYRVIINEGVKLAKRFGAVDGHKYVNAVLDRAARELRPRDNGRSDGG